jgi:hypothetical protein
MPKEGNMNNQKIAKFLLRSTVACMALLCVFLAMVPFVDVKAFASYLLGIALSSAAFLLYFVLWDKRGRLIVRTPQLPGKVFFWGTILAGMSFCTMFQTPPMSQMSQALMLFTVACLACSAVLATLLWWTTRYEPDK